MRQIAPNHMGMVEGMDMHQVSDKQHAIFLRRDALTQTIQRLATGLLAVGMSLLLAEPGLVRAADLDSQLDIRPFNSTATEETRALREEADQLLRIGERQVAVGQYEKALETWSQALARYEAIADFPGMGITYDLIGLTYGKLTRYPEAEEALRRRLAIARDNGDLLGQIYGWNNVGTIFLQRGNVNAAEPNFQEALTIAQSINSEIGQGLSLSNLGLVAATRGDYTQAIKLYEQAIAHRIRARDALGEANTLNNMGDAYRATEQYFLSAASHRAALRRGQDIGDISLQLRGLDGLAATYAAAGQPYEIPELLAERQRITDEYPDSWQALQTYRYLAEFYEQSGDVSTALQFYQQGLALAERLGETQEAAHLRYKVNNLQISLGQ